MTSRKTIAITTAGLGLLTLAAACIAPASPAIRRAHPDEEIDLSGTWNDRDANEVAAVMVHDCLTRPWSQQFADAQGRPPVIRLYPIRNRSSEHIETKFFTKQVEMELLNSGAVQVVADLEEAQDTRYERHDQYQHASDETVKAGRNETGSDYVLNGWIVSENDAAGGREVRAYVITMELIDSERNLKVWVKTHRIKKDIQRAAAAW